MMTCPQPEKAGGLFEAARLIFRPPSAARCAVVACYLSYEDPARSSSEFSAAG
ncbi:hypothetical protein [Pseudohongiella nitratireducens]|uniref:hypothetical protein n=1 Tax=Pseudohongiella nitratireducens TaxID=1768907 RepID=UPI0030EB28F8